MSTVEETLTTCLQTNAENAKVYPDQAPAGTLPPYIVYTQYAGARTHDLQGDAHLANPRFQIDCYALTKAQAVALKNEIRIAVLTCAPLNAVFIDDGSMQEPDTRLHRHRQDFSIWFYD